jgi:hypothetical protein
VKTRPHNGRYIIDWDGNVVPEPNLMKWAEWHKRHHPCKVARTDLDNGITVSTIFLGLDHGLSFLPDYEPELFETMAYRLDLVNGKMNFLDEQWRYPTWAAAAVGHIYAVAYYTETIPIPQRD